MPFRLLRADERMRVEAKLAGAEERLAVLTQYVQDLRNYIEEGEWYMDSDELIEAFRWAKDITGRDKLHHHGNKLDDDLYGTQSEPAESQS